MGIRTLASITYNEAPNPNLPYTAILPILYYYYIYYFILDIYTL